MKLLHHVFLGLTLLLMAVSPALALPQNPNWQFAGCNGVGAYPMIVPDPAVAGRVYLVSDVGGIWQSDNRGDQWNLRSNGLGNLKIVNLAVAPSDGGATWLNLGTSPPFGSATAISAPWTPAPVSAVAALYLGGHEAGVNFHAGWIDEFRVTQGLARRTADFVPSEERYAVDGPTKLLLRAGYSDAIPFKDLSASDHPVQAFGPVVDRAQYKASERVIVGLPSAPPPSTAYSYLMRVFDAAGNESAPSNAATVVTP